MDDKEYQHRVAEARDDLENGLMSDGAFEQTFQALLESAFEIGIWVKAVVEDASGNQIAVYQTSAAADGQPLDRRNVRHGAAHITLEHSIGRGCRLNHNSASGLTEQLIDLLKLHWSARDERTLLPRVDDAGMKARVLHAIADMAQSAEFFAVLHLDLDRFKAVNTDHGEVKGHLVIRTCADRMREELAKIGLVTRNGGEEFSAFMANDDPYEFFKAAERLRDRMETEEMPDIGRSVTCSIGMSVYESTKLPPIFNDIDIVLLAARDAEQRAKNEGRNRICLAGANGYGAETFTPPMLLYELLRSALASRVGLEDDRRAPFRTPFANTMAKLLVERLSASEMTLESIGQTVEKLKTAFDVQTVSLPWDAPQTLSPVASPREWPHAMSAAIPTPVWGSIVARALLTSTIRGSQVLGPNDDLYLRLKARDDNEDVSSSLKLVLEIRQQSGTLSEVSLGDVACEPPAEHCIRIGQPWYWTDSSVKGGILRARPQPEGLLDREALSPCLLLPIGDSAISAAKAIRECVADIVEIDDRPVIGGGLPDFWQSNLGRVVRAGLRNPNIARIIAVGSEEGAAQTIAWLKRSQEEWNARLYDLQRRIGIAAHHLIAFRARQIEFQIIGENSLGMLETLVELTASPHLPDPSHTQAINLNFEMSKRRLAVPTPTSSNQLSITDGLRCKTLADAYPQAIQLLRSSSDPPQVEPTRREFREFPCFKLVLTQPFQDEVPDFWESEIDVLEAYVERNFTSPDSLFGSSLATRTLGSRSVRDQAIGAAVDALKGRHPTRRILLPVASVGEKLDQPLGLSLIQVLPRQRDAKWYLDFQWIWRTVEGLVGFPFSAFGSIRWSRAFHESVRAQVEIADQPDRIELGQLTYLALSFHMFLDIGDLEIARAIVQDATR